MRLALCAAAILAHIIGHDREDDTLHHLAIAAVYTFVEDIECICAGLLHELNILSMVDDGPFATGTELVKELLHAVDRLGIGCIDTRFGQWLTKSICESCPRLHKALLVDDQRSAWVELA